MLSDIEKNWVSDLLKTLQLEDLAELAKTSTNGAIQPKGFEDSLNAILLHETNIRGILMRKKITRNVLFKYLHSKNISFPGNAEKHVLVDLVINLWSNSGSNVVALSENCAPSECTTEQILSKLGIKFAEWFYNRVNVIVMKNFNQSIPSDLEMLKPDDFWPDSKMSISLKQGTGETIAQFSSEGQNECLALMNRICSEYLLYFSPNLSVEGTKAISEPHGVVLVTCSGILHSAVGQQCVGLYEQMFGLIKNPLTENNWKIKVTQLILRSQQMTDLHHPSRNRLAEITYEENT